PCPAIDPCIRCGVCDPRNVPENALVQLEWMKPALSPAQQSVLVTNRIQQSLVQPAPVQPASTGD
ncbi:MAG TPA: hypothetical protein VJQ56_09790, partial [Blastocatellia bacterium]|nr:hypothetical protein [Blastocatellia bacterium]